MLVTHCYATPIADLYKIAASFISLVRGVHLRNMLVEHGKRQRSGKSIPLASELVINAKAELVSTKFDENSTYFDDRVETPDLRSFV